MLTHTTNASVQLGVLACLVPRATISPFVIAQGPVVVPVGGLEGFCAGVFAGHVGINCGMVGFCATESRNQADYSYNPALAEQISAAGFGARLAALQLGLDVFRPGGLALAQQHLEGILGNLGGCPCQ